MEKQVKDISQKIEAVYQKNGMEKHKYFLHSICIHDGTAVQGHFFSFIFDWF